MTSLFVHNVNFPNSKASQVSALLSSVEEGVLDFAASSPNTETRTRVPIGIQALAWQQLSDRCSVLNGLLNGVHRSYGAGGGTTVENQYDGLLQTLVDVETILSAAAADPNDAEGTAGRAEYVETVGDGLSEQLDGEHEIFDGSGNDDYVSDSEREDDDGDDAAIDQSGGTGVNGSQMTFTQIAGTVLREVGDVAELVSEIVLGIRPPSLEE